MFYLVEPEIKEEEMDHSLYFLQKLEESAQKLSRTITRNTHEIKYRVGIAYVDVQYTLEEDKIVCGGFSLFAKDHGYVCRVLGLPEDYLD